VVRAFDPVITSNLGIKAKRSFRHRWECSDLSWERDDHIKFHEASRTGCDDFTSGFSPYSWWEVWQMHLHHHLCQLLRLGFHGSKASTMLSRIHGLSWRTQS